MQMLRPSPLLAQAWLDDVFAAKAVGKGGIVHDEAARGAAVAKVETFLADSGWRVAGIVPSPLPGKDGNVEYLIGAQSRG